MVVDLSPVDDVDIDKDILDFATEVYCANCTHIKMDNDEDEPYCTYWDEPTRIETGWICSEYLPQGLTPPE